MGWFSNLIARRQQESHIGAERVRRDIEGRFNPMRRLEPANLSRWIDEFSAGNLRPLARLLYDLSDRDYTWMAAQRKTIRGISRCPWEIRIKKGHEDNPEAIEQRDALQDFYDNLASTDLMRQTRTGGMANMIRQMMLAERDYYSVHELLWRVENGRLRLKAVWVPVWMFEAKTGHLRFLPTEFGIDGVELVPGEWMAHCGDGLGVACAICATYKRLSLADWLAYGEHNATPGLHGKTQARIGSAEWQKTVEAVAAFAKEWSIVTGTDVELNKIDLGASGSLPYQPLIERMDRAISALWRGADLSTLSANTQGASLQGEEMDMLEQSCAEDITETIRSNLDAFVLSYYFGYGVEKKAQFELIPISRPNVDQEIRINEHLIQHGAKLSLNDELGRFGRRVIDEDDPSDVPMVQPQETPTNSMLKAWNENTPALSDDEKALAAAHQQDFREVALALAEAMQQEGQDFRAAIKAVREQFPDYFARMGNDNQAAKELEAAMRRAAIAAPEAVANEGNNDIEWRTINGQAVPIKNGEADFSALKKTGQKQNTLEKSKEQKSFELKTDKIGPIWDDNDPKRDKHNHERGKNAFVKCLETKQDVKNAMRREKFGAIDFRYGKRGTPEINYRDGFGIAKIDAKHPGTAHKMAGVVAYGEIREDPRRNGDYGVISKRNLVILRKKEGRDNSYVVTSYDEASFDKIAKIKKGRLVENSRSGQ